MKNKIEKLKEIYPAITQSEVAELLGVSRQRINQLCKKYSIKLENGRFAPRLPKCFYPKRKSNLYRCFDGEGRLLYVGISMHPLTRITKHAESNTTKWSDLVVRVEIERKQNIEDALLAEAIAIHNEHPLYNKSGGANTRLRLKAIVSGASHYVEPGQDASNLIDEVARRQNAANVAACRARKSRRRKSE